MNHKANHRTGISALALLALGIGVYLTLQHNGQEATALATAPPPANAKPGVMTNDAGSTPPDDPITSHPTVVAYLNREADKQRLKDYFAGEGKDDPAAIWALIESLEQQQRVLGFEALHLKLAWLEKQHQSRAEFDAAAQALMEDYRQRAAASGETYRPENIPGYTDYKARELEIIAQVNQMQSFPDGLSRAEYLRQQLLEARLAAYGESR